MSAADFVHLRLHSEFDVRRGCARLSGDDSAIALAAQQGAPALALTDTNVMFGAIKFYQNCRRHGVKPIIGCELRVHEKRDFYLLLLCATAAGYVNLCRLLSRAHAAGGWAREEWMTPEATKGLIALSGGRRGEIGALALHGKQKRALARAGEWAARFPQSFYLETWRAGGDDNALTKALAALAQKAGLPLLATHPIQCARAEDAEALAARMCIAAGGKLDDPRREKPFSPEPHMLSAAAMREKFADLPGAIANTAEVAKRCNFMFEFGKTRLPSLGQGEDSNAVLLRLAEAGLAKKIPDAPEAYRERLRYEAGVIAKMGFSDYFLIVTDFIGWAKKEGIPVGPGRGSGAGSLAAFALDITTLDPIKYGLLFERFLNPQRVSMPDFDVDFCVDGRDAVIDYVGEKYGETQVSQIVTFGGIGARGAIRDTGRVMGLPYGYCDKIARMVPEELNISLADSLKKSDELAAVQKTEEGGRLLALAAKVEGLPRNIGTHAGGVLITPRPLEEYCPRIVAADTQTAVSQFDMNDIEKIGLVKFDFLGLRTLTILNNAERQLRESGAAAADFSLENIPMDDEAVYRLYADGKMVGVFQCESAGMRDLMRRLRPDRFEDIIALMALFRPGPLSSGDTDKYIRHKKQAGEDWRQELLPVMREALAETYGVFVYQEQVMDVARRLAGYSPGEADLLRRAMGKKKEDEMARQRERFVAGAQKLNGVERRDASAIFDNISGFAGYGFNKSHAAAYALLSYRTAYLKARYPAHFLAAAMTAEAMSSDRVAQLAADAKRNGIEVLPPRVNHDGAHFVARQSAGGKMQICCGLRAVRGLGDAAIKEIIDARPAGGFADLADFCRRVPAVHSDVGQQLIAAGAMDDLHPNRAALAAALPLLQEANNGGGGLFGDAAAPQDAPPWSKKQTLRAERAALGFCLSGAFYDLHANALALTPQIPKAEEARPTRLVGVLARVVKPQQLGGRGYGIVVLTNQDGEEMEARADAELFRRFPDCITGEDAMVIEGETTQTRRGDWLVRARRLYTLDEFFAGRLRALRFRADGGVAVAALSAALPPQNGGNGGGCKIVVDYADGEIACECDLGENYAVGRAVAERLRALAGVKEMKAEFAPPSAH